MAIRGIRLQAYVLGIIRIAFVGALLFSLLLIGQSVLLYHQTSTAHSLSNIVETWAVFQVIWRLMKRLGKHVFSGV